jgi:Arc/MetJ family transcription regulator
MAFNVWDNVWVPTNLHIDDRLLDEAQRLGKHETKRETVDQALREYVARRKRLKALEAFGTIGFHTAWDYKADRHAGDARVSFVKEDAARWPAPGGRPAARKKPRRRR